MKSKVNVFKYPTFKGPYPPKEKKQTRATQHIGNGMFWKNKMAFLNVKTF